MEAALLALDVYQVDCVDSICEELSAHKEKLQNLQQKLQRMQQRLLRLEASAILPRLTAEAGRVFVSLITLILCGKPFKRACSLRLCHRQCQRPAPERA